MPCSYSSQITNYRLWQLPMLPSPPFLSQKTCKKPTSQAVIQRTGSSRCLSIRHHGLLWRGAMMPAREHVTAGPMLLELLHLCLLVRGKDLIKRSFGFGMVRNHLGSQV